jgi:hypothetical protein
MAVVMLPVTQVPSRPIKGMPGTREVHWVVPKGVRVTKGDHGSIFAEPGDHIVGTKDRAGISLAVFDRCPECEAAALGKGSWPFTE